MAPIVSLPKSPAADVGNRVSVFRRCEGTERWAPTARPVTVALGRANEPAPAKAVLAVRVALAVLATLVVLLAVAVPAALAVLATLVVLLAVAVPAALAVLATLAVLAAVAVLAELTIPTARSKGAVRAVDPWP